MPALLHSPADVVTQLLIDLGVGSDPEARPLAAWPVYLNRRPTEPDRLLTVVDATGQSDGRAQITGELESHYGFQVGVRGRTGSEAWVKADEARTALAEQATGIHVTLDATVYLVNAATNIGEPVRMGPGVGSNRFLYSVNAMLSVTVVPASPPPPALPTPAAVYRFDGALTDSSGNGHTLVPDSVGFTFAAGKIGSAVSDPGSDGILSATGVLSGPVAGSWAVSFWAFLPNDEESVSVGLDGLTPSVVSAAYYSDVLNGDPGGLVVVVGGVTVLGPLAPVLAAYRHVVLSCSGGSMSVYLDGSVVGTADLSALPDSFTGGVSAAWGFGGNAALDDLVFTPNPLTVADVTYLWNSGTGRPYPV